MDQIKVSPSIVNLLRNTNSFFLNYKMMNLNTGNVEPQIYRIYNAYIVVMKLSWSEFLENLWKIVTEMASVHISIRHTGLLLN